MKERIRILLLMMIAVPLAGELKFYPFDNTFRVNQQKLNQAIAMYHSKLMTVKEIQEATGVSAAILYRSLKKEQTS
ncbi:MAG: hypothetical protein ACQEWV_29410 [Bacillota bacterium]